MMKTRGGNGNNWNKENVRETIHTGGRRKVVKLINLGNKLKLSCAKLKFSLVTVVTVDETEVIVVVWYLSGWWVGGWSD